MNTLSKLSTGVRLTLVFVALLAVDVAHAELRVLIKFDSQSHRVHRLVKVESANPALVADQTSQESVTQNPGKVNVLWKGADDTVLQSASIADPRLTHAPLSGADTSPTMVGISDGAYMVTGPANSTHLEIYLPANPALALAAQIWRFELNL